MTQNLTLNLGLRYEYWTAFADASGLYSTFDPNIAGGMVVYQGSGLFRRRLPPAVFRLSNCWFADRVRRGRQTILSACSTCPKTTWNHGLALPTS